MSRMSVTIEEELIEEAQKVLGAESRSEAVRIALKEAVRQHRLAAALAHRGAVDLRISQTELARLRAEG